MALCLMDEELDFAAHFGLNLNVLNILKPFF
jgi:hypothetical protein